MALVESHDCNWEASGCTVRSFLVCVWYDFKAALKMSWKREEAEAVEGVWDMGEVAIMEGSKVQVSVEIRDRGCTPPHGLVMQTWV